MSDNLPLSTQEVKTLRDFLNLGRALTSSLTSSQIASLASGLGELTPLLQNLSHPGAQRLVQVLTASSDTLADLIQLIVTYHKSGTIRNALELATLFGVVRDALSTPGVAHLAEAADRFMVTSDQVCAEVGGIEGVRGLIHSAKKACEEAEQDENRVGIMGLLKALKEPQVQKGIKFLLLFSKNISMATTDG